MRSILSTGDTAGYRFTLGSWVKEYLLNNYLKQYFVLVTATILGDYENIRDA